MEISTKTKRYSHLLIIIKISWLRRIKRDVPTEAKAGLEVKAQGCRDRRVRLVKVDSAAVVGEALLKIKAHIKTIGAFVIQE